MLFQWAHEGRDFPVLGDGNQLTQMLDVDDLCAVTMNVLDLPASATNDTYNIAATEFRSIAEDFQAVLDRAGRGGRIRRLPLAPAVVVLRLAAAARASPVYPRLIYKLRSHSYVCTAKAQQHLGFSPAHSNASTLLRTFEWWREDADAQRARPGTAHTQPWRQGALRLVKPLF
jgi:nucleoside-diphosphate-sugar epimerase